MANVTPGYTFTGTTDPITYTKLNLVAQPTVSIGNDEVTSSMLASGLTLEDITVTGGLEVADTGLTVTAGGATITAGGLTITAGGATVTAGGLTVTAGGATVSAGGLTVTAGGITLGSGTGLFTAATTETFSGTIALTFGADKGNTRIIDCSSSTASTINAASVPAAGYILILRFKTDGTASNTITFGTNFKKTGTYALNSANHYYQIMFVSDGTFLCEVCRSGGAN
jgi:hypothetical protein